MSTPVTLPQFLTHFPEFTDTPTDLKLAKLAEAERTTPGTLYPTDLVRQDVVMYLAARLLALSPEAVCMRLSGDSTVTVYDARWNELRQSATAGYRVI